MRQNRPPSRGRLTARRTALLALARRSTARAARRGPEMTDPIGLRRSLTHYGDPDFALYLRRSFARSMGYSTALLERPVIGIANTASGLNNCHRLGADPGEGAKRGVLCAGWWPRARCRWSFRPSRSASPSSIRPA